MSADGILGREVQGIGAMVMRVVRWTGLRGVLGGGAQAGEKGKDYGG